MRVFIDPEGYETGVIHQLIDFSGKAVLEIGCGDGRMTRGYAERAASVLALDPNEERIQQAIANTPDALTSKVGFLVGDITDIELPQEAFEVAVLSHSL